MEETNTVFVYGTLKKGFGNHNYLLGHLEPLAEDKLAGHKMYSLGGFPAIVESDNEEDVVYGELYEVNPAELRRLDGLEGYRDGYAGFYDRKTVTTVGGVEALVYFMHEVGENRPLVESGVWEGGDYKQVC